MTPGDSPAVLTPSEVDAALGTVIDPELDEPVTDLGFVTERTVVDGDVAVHLRLPTAFCSPNFAYLMVADAHDAIAALPGVRTVRIVLDDHHDSDRINRGVAAGLGFAGTYPDEAAGELDQLRRTFRVKAHTAFIERVCGVMIRDHGWGVTDLARLTIADLPAKSRDGLGKRRADLGLSRLPGDAVLVDEDGTPWAQDEIPVRLRYAKSVRISIDGNAHFCRGLLRTRYPDAADDQRPRSHDGFAADLGVPAIRHRGARGAVEAVDRRPTQARPIDQRETVGSAS
jgi:metal-sulfur cluster biosynthetic enzyme